MLDLTHEPDLGFIFSPHDMAHHPGHPRLDIIIPAEPTFRHFDPQKVEFQIVSAAGDIGHLCIHHPWSMGRRYQVCAGLIFVRDRIAKVVEAFSFGGDLQIFSDEEHTVCALVSPAPIFPLFTTLDLPMWLVAEFEILLAEQKAHCDPRHPHDFDAQLAGAKPFLLYASCLQALQRKMQQVHSGAEELDRQGRRFVLEEIARFQAEGAWPLKLPTLDELF